MPAPPRWQSPDIREPILPQDAVSEQRFAPAAPLVPHLMAQRGGSLHG
jgi:hypothetical protein